jgi:hypothetical protein
MSIKDVVKYQDPKSLFIVNETGQMRQLFVPIKARCIEAVDHIPFGSWIYIDAIFLHRKFLLLYWVNNSRLLPYYHFTIKITW